jgi:hypothetical protein
MQIFLGQAPPIVWWGVLILLLAVAASIVVRSYARLTAVRGHIKVALAALQANTEKSTPSKRTPSK